MAENKLDVNEGNILANLKRVKIKRTALERLSLIVKDRVIDGDISSSQWEDICIFADACKESRDKSIFYEGNSLLTQLGPCVDGGLDCFHYKAFFEGRNPMPSYD